MMRVVMMIVNEEVSRDMTGEISTYRTLPTLMGATNVIESSSSSSSKQAMTTCHAFGRPSLIVMTSVHVIVSSCCPPYV